MSDIDIHYKHNLKFWEDAWQRVKNPYRKLADLDYIPDIPETFKRYNCKTILDIACGSGWLSFYLASFGFEPVGIDISPSAIDLAHRWLAEDQQSECDSIGGSLSVDAVSTRAVASAKIVARGSETATQQADSASCAVTATQQIVKASDKAKFYVADMMNLEPIRSKLPLFDGLLVNAAFEHLNYSRGREFLKEMSRTLKKGGIMFAIFDKVATGAQGDYVELEDGTKMYIDKFRDGMFLRYYSDAELRALLSDCGWKVLSWRENVAGSRIVVAENQLASASAAAMLSHGADACSNSDTLLNCSVGEHLSNQRSLFNVHTFATIVVSGLVYFFYSKNLAQGIFLSSAVFHLYLRLLCSGFATQSAIAKSVSAKSSEAGVASPVHLLVSGFRTLIAAGLLYLLVTKMQIQISAIVIALILFVGVLIFKGLTQSNKGSV